MADAGKTPVMNDKQLKEAVAKERDRLKAYHFSEQCEETVAREIVTLKEELEKQEQRFLERRILDRMNGK